MDNTRKVSKAFNTQVLFGTSFTFLTSGVFLSGLAIYMGASDLLVSYISMIANICGISILFFSSIIGRFRSYKKLTLILTFLSKFTTLMLVLIPLFVQQSYRLPVFVPLMILAFTFQAQTTVVLNNWLILFVNEKESGRYIARRQTFVLIVTVVLSLAGGRLLDAVSGAYVGFLLLFSIALLMGVAELIVLFSIPDGIPPAPQKTKSRFTDMIKVPVLCKPYLGFVLYIFVFYLLLSLSDSFTMVYMMRYLKLSYSTITVMQLLLSMPQIFLLGLWGRISDRKGHTFVLAISICFFAGETLLLGFSNPQNLYFFIPAAFLFASIGNSGFVISVFNRRYELMPKEGRILYDNFYSAVIGLAFILGPVTGGGIKALLESIPFVSKHIPLGNIRLLYAISTIGLIGLQTIVFARSKRTGSF